MSPCSAPGSSLLPEREGQFYVDGWAVFEDVPNADLPWRLWPMLLQKRGFRHVSWVQRRADGWVVTSALFHLASVEYFPDTSIGDYIAFMVGRGATVVRVQGWRDTMTAWPEVLNCVTLTKRLCGEATLWIQTPWQLYRALRQEHRYG